MKVFMLLYLFILTMNLLSSNNINSPSSNQQYIFTYIFTNPSLGPVEGTEKLKILMKNKNILSVWSLKSGQEIKNFRLFNTLLNVINGNTQDLKVEYDSNNFPKKIVSIINKMQLGGWYSIEIKDFKFINDLNYTINIKQIRMDEFKLNHQKWVKINVKKYHYIYQDSREEDLNMEGVEVLVDNEKIIKAKGIRSNQSIADIKNQSFYTIRKLFAIIKKSLEENRQVAILYDEKYGYPYWIALKESSGNLHTIFSRNFRKGVLDESS